MKAGKPEPVDLRERYLGEIAPLLEAAREVERLSPTEKRLVRKRILRTLFGIRAMGLRGRLVPVLVALALLVFGGAAFATAQRLGLLPRLGGLADEKPPASSQVRKRKGTRSRPSVQQAASAEAPIAVSGESPVVAPLVVAPPVVVPVAPSGRAVSVGAPASVASATAHKPTGRPGRLLARAAPSTLPAVIRGPAAPVMLAPAEAPPAPAIPAPADEPAVFFAPSSAPAARPAPVMPAPLTTAPPLAQASAPVMPAPMIPASPPATTPSAPVAPVIPASSYPVVQAAPPPASGTIVTKPGVSDQALFGQALRKLRAHNDPAGALAALREHGQTFPKSPLAGERIALEVEALLDLHRDRDALALLDTMALEQLPRSGERLVVRAELRAAAKRWREAKADYDRALSRVSGSPSWHERALWGRGVSRLRLGDRAGGSADIERYRETYPKGRFAAEAAKLAPGP